MSGFIDHNANIALKLINAVQI